MATVEGVAKINNLSGIHSKTGGKTPPKNLPWTAHKQLKLEQLVNRSRSLSLHDTETVITLDKLHHTMTLHKSTSL